MESKLKADEDDLERREAKLKKKEERRKVCDTRCCLCAHEL
jgi:hypothetical protein